MAIGGLRFPGRYEKGAVVDIASRTRAGKESDHRAEVIWSGKGWDGETVSLAKILLTTKRRSSTGYTDAPQAAPSIKQYESREAMMKDLAARPTGRERRHTAAHCDCGGYTGPGSICLH